MHLVSADTCATGSSWSVKSGQLAVLAIAYDGINWRANNRIHQVRGFPAITQVGLNLSCAMVLSISLAEHRLCQGTVHSLRTGPHCSRRMICRDDGLVVGDFQGR